MSFVKSPYFPALVCAIIIGIVLYMLFRDVGSMKGTMSDLVTQHNNAQKALENHGDAIKRLQDVDFVMDGEDEDEEMYGKLATIEEEVEEDPEIKPDVSQRKKKGV